MAVRLGRETEEIEGHLGMNRCQAAWREWCDAALGLLYPNVCQICRQEPAAAAEGYVGEHCRQEVRYVAEPFCAKCGLPYEGEITGIFECSNCRDLELNFEWARAAVAATGVVREAIHRYKYDGAVWFEPFLAGLLVGRAADELRFEDWDYIVPVPLHSVKERHREFNQAQRMGRALSRATGIPLGDVLRRTGATETQTLLTRSARAANVQRAFALRPGCRVRRKRIVLVDDVLTTGATTSACAGELRKSGAELVVVWTVARGL